MEKHNDASKKKIWEFVTFNTDTKIDDEISIFEEVFCLTIEIMEIKTKIADTKNKKEKLMLLKKVSNKKQYLHDIKMKLNKNKL
jgi:hypothetical protein